MKSEATYLLRWKGRQMGPFSLATIERKLDDHEIGTLHEVRIGDTWVTLGTWLEQMSSPPVVSEGIPIPTHARQPANARAFPMRPRPVQSSPASAWADDRSVAPALDRDSPTATETERRDASEDSESDYPEVEQSRRRRWVFILLGVTMGFLGIHNFYAGYWTRGASQLALSVLTTWLGFGWLASWLWALADVAFVRRDGARMEMR